MPGTGNLTHRTPVTSRTKRRPQVKEAVVIGAGPYGLSTVAHLRNVGIEPYAIGKPMAYWKDNMPAGMILRSKQEASNIDAPGKHLSLRAFQRTIGKRLADPLRIEEFVAYGDWVQQQIAPNLDSRHVEQLSRNGTGFVITMEDGETLHAQSVVLALGIGPFLYRPDVFAGIPGQLAPHAAELNDLAQFRGKRIMVLGKGQSALESAAILHENGADVEIVTRAHELKFRPFAWRKHLFRTLTPGPLRPLSYMVLPPTDLGDIKTARKMAHPDRFRRQSPEIQEKLLNDCRRPVGAFWLEPRLQGAKTRTDTTVVRAEAAGDGLRLTFSDGSSDRFDRVLLGTGYRIDISKYRILHQSLAKQIEQTSDGYPVLTTGLETSIKGLYMAGVVGEKTLGPTLRFVTGTSNASPRIAAAMKAARSTAR